MEKRLTMIFACLFLFVGMALAQTKVNGTVVSQEVADEFGMSPRGIKYIVYRGEAVIFKHI